MVNLDNENVMVWKKTKALNDETKWRYIFYVVCLFSSRQLPLSVTVSNVASPFTIYLN